VRADVERAEVLRGRRHPFGKMGGAIRVFSKQPSAEKDAYLKVTGGNFEHYDISGMINVPLSDELYLRAQGAYLSEEGFVQRGPQMLGSSDDSIARLQLGWHPSDELSFTFGAMYTNSESDGSPTEMNEFNMLLEQDCPSGVVCWQGN
jgi:outer membrane receptor protein involved in Fe transport